MPSSHTLGVSEHKSYSAWEGSCPKPEMPYLQQ